MDSTTELPHVPVLVERSARPVPVGERMTYASVGHETFVRLFNELFEPLHRYLSRLSGDGDLASDIAQEAFVRLYRRRALPDDPQAWLFTVATNLFRNAKTKRSNRVRLLTVGRGLRVHSDPIRPPDAEIEAGEARRRVRSALDTLNDRDKSLLLLAAEGHSYREMSTVLALREASVGTLLRRAKQAFRQAYEEAPDAS